MKWLVNFFLVISSFFSFLLFSGLVPVLFGSPVLFLLALVPFGSGLLSPLALVPLGSVPVGF